MANLRWLLAALVIAPLACGTDDERRGGKNDDDDDNDGVDPPATVLTALPGVTITEIAAYQGVKVPLVQNGAPAQSSVPLVAGRDAFVRVFVATDASYTGEPVTARLWVGDAPQPLEVTAQSVYPSTDADLGSTLNFELGGMALASNTSYRVEIGRLVEGTAEAPPHAFPASGTQSITVTSVGAVLKVQIVPISYGADGSNRLPDTSEAALAKLRDRFFSLYPAPRIELTVRAPVQHNGTVSPFGEGWQSLLMKIADLRQADDAPPDVYYHGLFDPAPTFFQFCGQGCVTGLGMQGQAGDPWSRASIGVGFGEVAADTAVHEVGHAHGRAHAPCQTFDSDPAYPYANGAIGVWGYDLLTGAIFPPETADFMGYCDPRWVSDYTFNALIQRMKLVNQASFTFPPEQLDRTYERVLVTHTGEATALSDLSMHLPPLGETTEVEIGGKRIEAQRFGFDHLDGELVVWPSTRSLHQASEITIGGRRVSLR